MPHPSAGGIHGGLDLNTATMLQRGQAWPLNITLFELYPSYTGSDPAWSSSAQSLSVDTGTAVECAGIHRGLIPLKRPG